MKLLYTFLKDLRMSFRSFYIYIEIIMAVIIIAVLLFIVPEQFTTQTRVYARLDLEEPFRQSVIDLLSQDSESGVQIILVDSEEELREKLESDRMASGIFITQAEGKINFNFVLQGYESEQVRNILEKSFIAGPMQQLPGVSEQIQVTVLDQAAEKLPDRINLLPILLLLNSALIGLFIIAAYIYMDKDEGTIRAYAVTPATIWQYLLAKVGMMLATGLLTGVMTVLAVAGTRVHLPAFIVFMAACNVFGSVLGLLIASFFNTLTKSLGALYVAVIVMGLASVSYMTPVFSPLAIRLLPAYPMLFAFRETLLSQPDFRYIFTWAAIFTGASVLIFLAAQARFKKTLTV